METLKPKGDSPLARFGHTVCLISKTKAVLFGGATGDSGKYVITNDTYSFDTTTLVWKKLDPTGSRPSQRAAHASCSIEFYQMIVFGGATGGGGLTSDELYLLDLKNGEDKAQWITISVIGTTPGRRYGHSLVFCKPFILVFGGNTGTDTVNDVWSLNLEKSPFSWSKLDTSVGEAPPVRVYHATSLCTSGSANGMMIVFGGRTSDQSALNDTWGLRRHRDGRWDWVKAPYKNPEKAPLARYQHSTLFSGTLLLIVGGRTNQVGELLPFEIYDTDTSDWFKFNPVQRFRHAIWLIESILFIHGGFDQESPNIPTDNLMQLDLEVLFKNNQNLIKTSSFSTRDVFNPQGIPHPKVPNSPHRQSISNKLPVDHNNITIRNPEIQVTNSESKTKIEENNNNVKDRKFVPQNIRLSPIAVMATSYGPEDKLNGLVTKIPIEKLQEEAKKLGVGFHDPLIIKPSAYYEGLYSVFINLLLIPKDYSPDYRFNMKKELIIKLCDEVQKILQNDSSLIRIRSPIKIFGNIHGQFGDLMKLFDYFGSPSDIVLEGDIDSIDYLFLGDYVNKGTNSLEIICLLFALKMKFPDQIHLLRGHHEDKVVNKVFGFAEECAQKFGEDINSPLSVYQRINKVFEYLPLAALIDNKFFCVHGGIGNTLKSIKELDNIPKPIEISHNYEIIKNSTHQKIINELLWTDPVLNETDTEIDNPCRYFFGVEEIRGKRFTIERITDFLKENSLSLIIRSHEIVKDGFENLDNKLITINSCLDYCGKMKNAGGILKIKKNYELIPKIINPAGQVNNSSKWFDFEELNKKKNSFQTNGIIFDEKELKIRKNPPSPARTKPGLKK